MNQRKHFRCQIYIVLYLNEELIVITQHNPNTLVGYLLEQTGYFLVSMATWPPVYIRTDGFFNTDITIQNLPTRG
jgi:hypothetical protein